MSSIAVARLRRFCAAGAAVLVLLLTAFAVSPQLHGWLHHETADHDDGCAIVLFSNGVTLAAGYVALTPPSMERQVERVSAPREIFLVPARYLRQPERGPPVA